MTKHTPGPWGVDDAGGEAPFGVFAEDGDAVCYLTENPMGGLGLREYAEDQANARLIAAAPDLLKAAKDALESLTECGPHRSEGLDCEACGESIAALRAAISAAEGVE